MLWRWNNSNLEPTFNSFNDIQVTAEQNNISLFTTHIFDFVIHFVGCDMVTLSPNQSIIIIIYLILIQTGLLGAF